MISSGEWAEHMESVGVWVCWAWGIITNVGREEESETEREGQKAVRQVFKYKRKIPSQWLMLQTEIMNYESHNLTKASSESTHTHTQTHTHIMRDGKGQLTHKYKKEKNTNCFVL